MKPKTVLAWTVPIGVAGVLIGATVRDRVIEPTVAGGLVAILAAIVALFAIKGDDE